MTATLCLVRLRPAAHLRHARANDSTDHEGREGGPGTGRCGGLSGSAVRAQPSQTRHERFVPLAPPRAVPKP